MTELKTDAHLLQTTVITSALIDLQCVDCNCNDCVFMIRDTEKFKQSLEQHHKWQYDYFITIKNKLVEKAEFAKKKFQFDKSECTINYGKCSKLNKDVSFIPNTLQLETQSCFKHRRLWHWL